MDQEIDAVGGVEAAGLGDAPNPRWQPLPQNRAAPRREAAAGAADSTQVGVVFEVEGGDVIVKVVDRETRKVLREIPPEEMRRLQAALQSERGIVLDGKA